ncbi:MAG: hypothetical protein ACR2P9_08710 [Gammaproteobacteria bacterium]
MMQEALITTAIKSYIHTFTAKRHKEANKRSDRKNLVIYDLDQYEVLEAFAKTNNTNVSSIVNNLYEGFLKAVSSPQKTIDSFEIELQVPLVTDSEETWKNFYKTLSMEDYKKLDQKINLLMILHNKRWEQLR